jgi:hypothetical protein
MAARFVPVPLLADLSALPDRERQALAKLVQAARIMDTLFLRQVWAGNETLLLSLIADNTPLGRAHLHYFLINKGPWSRLDRDAPFIPGVDPKPPSASFYPAGATKDEVEAWLKSLPEAEGQRARGFFTTIRWAPDGRLTAVPYSVEYQAELARAASLLREAAAATSQPTLKGFLDKRAEAFLTNDYYASDVAWMELDASVEPTIGPYEVYEDGWFNAKAAFEVFVTLRDNAETARLARFAGELQELEDHLPIDPRYRNPKLGALAPIRVVNVIFSAGDGNRGVQTAAFNLPNDERVVQEKGTKRVMLKNIQVAKFEKVLVPVSRVALPLEDRKGISFDAFFTHILMHELMHGLGPHQHRGRGAKDHRARGAEEELQRAGGGQGQCLRALGAAVPGGQGRARQVHGTDDVHDVPGVLLPRHPLRAHGGPRQGHRPPAQHAPRFRGLQGPPGRHVHRRRRPDQVRRHRAHPGHHDPPGRGRPREGHRAPDPGGGGEAKREARAGPAEDRARGHRAPVHDRGRAGPALTLNPRVPFC